MSEPWVKAPGTFSQDTQSDEEQPDTSRIVPVATTGNENGYSLGRTAAHVPQRHWEDDTPSDHRAYPIPVVLCVLVLCSEVEFVQRGAKEQNVVALHDLAG